ncbi:hypothetical protein ACTA9V_005041, partial [Escherichia coli]
RHHPAHGGDIDIWHGYLVSENLNGRYSGINESFYYPAPSAKIDHGRPPACFQTPFVDSNKSPDACGALFLSEPISWYPGVEILQVAYDHICGEYRLPEI